jgi:hypothetical protein
MNAVWFGVAVVLIASIGGLAFALKRRDPEIVGSAQEPRSIDLSDPLVQRLRADLHTLDAMPLLSKDDRARWYVAAGEFRAKLRHDYASIYDALPHELEHYLADADIRARDASYAQYQKSKLGGLFA